MPNKYSLVLDSSQISCFLECPEQWNNSYVKSIVPAGQVQQQDKTAMNAGTYGHKILDIFYRNRAAGVNLQESLARAISYDPDTDTCICGCNRESHKHIEALHLTECGRCHKCVKVDRTDGATWQPEPFALDKGTRIAVQNRLREYFFTYQHNDFEPLSPKHVEVGFSETVFEDSENLFVLEGRIDLLAKLQGLTTLVDHKFQMRRHELYTKSIQFRNYALVAKSTMLIINYIRLAKNADNQTLVRQPVCFTVPELLVWKQKLIQIFFRIKQASLEAKRSGQPMEQNFGSCMGKYSYICPYTTLCEEFNPDVALLKERQLYQVKGVVWRPW